MRTEQEQEDGGSRSIFADLVGREVKVPYRDGGQVKVARGVLVAADGGFVKIRGQLGTIIISERNAERMSVLE